MITRLHTFEGVPVGGNNFEDLLSYIRSFLSANFSFSTSAVGNQGGFFLPDDFEFTAKDAVSPSNSAYFFGPSTVAAGSLFGKRGDEYYRFEVLNHVAADPNINVWTVLATDSSTNDLTYANTSESNKFLPYRPVYKNVDDDFENGYQEVRFNGVPQDDYSVNFVTSGNFQEQELDFETVVLCPELPKPVKDDRYAGFSLTEGFTKDELDSNYDSKLTFEFTNFATEFGGHILLHKPGTELYVYLPMDYGTAGEVATGTYRVLDYARGIIELNPSPSQLELLRTGLEVGDPNSTVNFIVISTEQLLQDTVNNITRYRTRYGGMYNGDIDDVVLVEYVFDGNSHLARKIPNSEYTGVAGDIILSDVNNNYTGNIVLAAAYRGLPSKESLLLAQKNRYQPDTIQLYYNTGIILPTAGGTSSVRAVVEINSGSWYNQDVVSAEYSPVSRTEEAFYSLLTTAETGNFTITFNPDQQFEIVDTIGLANLNDVASVDTGDVLVYDGAVFQGVQFTLANLLDTNVSGVAANSVLQYHSGSSSWIIRTPTQMMTSTNISSPLLYSSLHTISSSNHIPHKSYVDGAISSAITTHNNTTAAHNATTGATPSRIVIRDSNGNADVASSSNALSSNSENIVNINYLRNTASSTAQTANRLILRDNNGRASVVTPISSTQIANKSYVDGLAILGNLSAIYSGRLATNGSALHLPPGWSVSSPSTGQRVVTHNLGTTEYTVFISTPSTASVHIISNATATSFTFYLYGISVSGGTDMQMSITNMPSFFTLMVLE